MILGGEIRLGARLVEVELADTLGVGRSTLREALRKLEGEGLLVAGESGGMRLIGLDQRELVATVQVRAALEAMSAGLAAGRVKEGRVSPAELRELGSLAEAARSATREAAVLADRHFHRAIATLGANQPCRDALNHVWDRLVIAAVHCVAGAERVALVERDHHELLGAICAGDEIEACAIARRHALAALM
jgi:DNA-binding GntR family transcriptional regulator